MNLGYSIHPEAAEELSEGIAWYERAGAERADEFDAAFAALIGRLLQWPDSGSQHRVQAADLVVRQAKIPRSPYWVIYYVEHETLFVIAVAHERRKPGYWKDRQIG